MICRREPAGREGRKAFQAEGWPEQRLDVHGALQAVHPDRRSRRRARDSGRGRVMAGLESH